MSTPASNSIGMFEIGISPVGQLTDASFDYLSDSAIGNFTIGVSPIGVLNAFDYTLTIISQYANSPILTQLIDYFNQNVDQTENMSAFYNMIWNIDTAQGYGLDVWGRIVGVSRVLQVSAGKYFGFEEGGTTDYDNFGPGGVSPFYAGQPVTNNFALTDDAYRTLIFAKALYNICDGSIPGINAILMSLFGQSGQCYVTDGQDMTMTYTFAFTPTPVQESIIFQSGVLPKPVGVAATVVIL